jgi:hypothetical protein
MYLVNVQLDSAYTKVRFAYVMADSAGKACKSEAIRVNSRYQKTYAENQILNKKLSKAENRLIYSLLLNCILAGTILILK